LTKEIDAGKYRERLLARERELVEETAHFDAEAREAGTAEVQDAIDAATSDENKAANFQMGDLAARTLQQVRAALQRIEDGTFGYCIDCGKPIEPARLDAVPWTPYCREHQERHDKSDAAKEDSWSHIA
jgi:DnaK suppressor protein